MRLVEIPEENLRFNVPSELAECNAREYMEMCELIFLYHTHQLALEEFKVQAIYRLLNLKASKRPLSEREEQDKLSNIYLLSSIVDDFFEETEEGNLLIKQNYIHNPVPSFKPLMVEFHGPTDSFLNLSHGEYVDALRLFHQFHATPDVSLLYLIAAILYRPQRPDLADAKKSPDYNGDVRARYNSKLIDERAEHFKRVMPMGFIYGVFLLFASFQKWIKTAKIPWGGKEIDMSILYESSGDGEPETVQGIGMDSISFSLAESGVFGVLDDLRAANNWEVLIRMHDLRKRDLDQQQQQKKKT